MSLLTSLASKNQHHHRTQYVIKRDGTKEPVSFDQIRDRIAFLSQDLDIDIIELSKTVCNGVHDGVKTSDLDMIAADVAMDMALTHPDYAKLAANLLVSNHQKNTVGKFSKVIEALYNFHDYHNKWCPMIAEDVYNIVQKNAEILDSTIDYQRDYLMDYFGFKTLAHSYLLKINDLIQERAQDLWMRVAVGIHKEDIESAIKTYHLLSLKKYIHGSPTLFNAGTFRPQFNSCFLIAMKDDSLDGIKSTWNECADYSKWGGGIGFWGHNIRAKGSLIRGTGGKSNGLVPMLRVFEAIANYVDQGGGKRKGAFAFYLEIWHADIRAVLRMKRKETSEKLRALDLFYALWICDLFMERVINNEMWSLMCPDKCPGLYKVYGEEFNKLYLEYEAKKMYNEQIPARKLFEEILRNLCETGTPYIMFKDAVNRKTNQMNLGTTGSSNLCCETTLYSDEKETGVCTLASLGLPSFVKTNPDGIRYFDFDDLFDTVKQAAKNLDRIIDESFYPSAQAELSSKRHRPIGIGQQGLADVFALMRYPFGSPEARELNRNIAETIYFAAVTASHELALQKGAYETFVGSPMSFGQFQFDLWKAEGKSYHEPSGRWDWESLRQKVITDGVRNSLLVAMMPTASTSQICGFTECFEAFTSNLYVRETNAGNFYVVNKYLINDLVTRGLWNEEIRDQIIFHNGQIKNIPDIPDDLKELYKTVWEIPPETIIEMTVDRGQYVCQAQSMNLFIERPTPKNLEDALMKAYRLGSKNGVYYLRSSAVVEAKKLVDNVSTPAASTPTIKAGTATPPKTLNLTATSSQKQPSPLVCRRDDPCCLSCHG